MMQKLRTALTRLTRLPARDDGALTFLQLAALVMGPIVAGTLALGAVTALRVGGDLGTMFTRDASLHQMVERLQQNLSNVTEMDVQDELSFTAHDQPSKRPAYYVPSANMPDVCVTNEWSLVDEGGITRTLRNVTLTHETDSCDSDVVRQTERTMGGFTMETHFVYENAYGRDLVFVAGTEAGAGASENERPDGLFNNEWEHASPGFVTLSGTMNQAIGSTPVEYTAKTPLKQLRPGVVSTDLGELGPPLIERVARGGDTFRARFSALTVLNDPRTKIEWSWREAKNVGSDKTSLPTEAQWGSWSGWSGVDHFDSTVRQGSKWQVQAKYRVVIDDEHAESETVTMTWVRSIDKPAAPTVTINLNTTAAQATITVAPATCPTGTVPHAQIRSLVNDGAWTGWLVRTGAPFTRTVAVAEGAKITANGQARCATVYTESAWASSAAANPTAVQPITTAPVIDSITAAVAVPEDRGTAQAALSNCPAGTTYQAAWSWRLNAQSTYQGDGVFRAVPQRPSVDAAAVREGDRFQAGITVRCVSPHFTDSPETERFSSWEINPIRMRPTVTSPSASITGATGTVSANLGACAPWMTYQARAAGQTSGAVGSWTSMVFGTPTAASAGANSRTYTGSITPGHALRGGLSARCVTPYAQGPYNQAVSSTYAVRDNQAPTVGAASGSLSAGGQYTITASIGSCASGSTLRVRGGRLNDEATTYVYTGYVAAAPGSNSVTFPGSIGEGKRIRGHFQAYCVGPYNNSGATEGSDASWAIRPVTAPTVGAASGSLSSSGIFTATATIGSCAPGTTLWAHAGRQNDEMDNYLYTGLRQVTAGSVATSFSTVVKEGSRIRGHVSAECRGTYATSPRTQGGDSAYFIRPVTAPTVGAATGNLSGSSLPISASIGSCASGTQLRVGNGYLLNEESSGWQYRSWADASAGTNSRTVVTGLGEGKRASGRLVAYCDGPYADSSWTYGATTGWKVRPVSNPSTTTATGSWSGRNLRATSTIGACASGTQLQIATSYIRQGESTWVYRSDWKDVSPGTHTVTSVSGVPEGARWAAGIQARCNGTYADSSGVNRGAGWHTRPISTVPSGTAYGTRSGGNIYGNVINRSACPSGTVFHWRVRSKQGSGGYGAWSHTSTSVGKSGVRGWYTTSTAQYTRFISPGYNATVQVHFLCASDYANGVGVYREDTTSTRPYPTPSAPGGVYVDSVISASNGRGLVMARWESNASTYATKYRYYGRGVFAGGVVADSAVRETTGRIFTAGCMQMTRAVTSFTGYVSAGNSAGWSGYSSDFRSGVTAYGGSSCN